MRYRGRSEAFWLGRLVNMSREGGIVTALMLIFGVGFVAGLLAGSFLAGGWLIGILLLVALIVGGFVGAQFTGLAIAADAWSGENSPG